MGYHATKNITDCMVIVLFPPVNTLEFKPNLLVHLPERNGRSTTTHMVSRTQMLPNRLSLDL